MSDYFHASPTSTSFIAGGFAGAVSRTIVSPLERMKILFQIQGPGAASYTGVSSTLAKMYREEGWRGFMAGNGTNCIRIVPYSACQFAAYTTYKRVTSLTFNSLPGEPVYMDWTDE
jgi:solute carrier family 25 phosphate transporter 23/24/25/41